SQGLIGYALWPFIALIVGIFLSQRINQPRLMLVPALLWLVLDTNILLIQCLIQYLGSNGYLNFIPDAIYNGILPG
ncbi:peptidase C13 family protein, partial [Acinetobacter bereziniae]|nr:peptidase C13 family protein [Acinetobacter bereziniae]